MKKKFIIGIVIILLFIGVSSPYNKKDNNSSVTSEISTEETITEESYENNEVTTIATQQSDVSEGTTEQLVTENSEPEYNVHGNAVDLDYIPPFSDKEYVEVDSNIPYFLEEDLTEISFEVYSDLDELGRPGVAYACIGKDIMPIEERGEIGQFKPVGWHTVKYDCIEDRYLYNRCHIIGYQLTGENDNIKNLMTGTRYLNVKGMLGFENMVAEYVEKTGNHVLYRVTPIYEGDNLLATGVQMEGYSVEDKGQGVCFNVFCYNSQPGIVIDYKTGDSYALEISTKDDSEEVPEEESEDVTDNNIDADYIANKNTYKFHHTWCSSVKDMKEKNKWYYNGSRDELINIGYKPCGNCNP